MVGWCSRRLLGGDYAEPLSKALLHLPGEVQVLLRVLDHSDLPVVLKTHVLLRHPLQRLGIAPVEGVAGPAHLRQGPLLAEEALGLLNTGRLGALVLGVLRVGDFELANGPAPFGCD